MRSKADETFVMVETSGVASSQGWAKGGGGGGTTGGLGAEPPAATDF